MTTSAPYKLRLMYWRFNSCSARSESALSNGLPSDKPNITGFSFRLKGGSGGGGAGGFRHYEWDGWHGGTGGDNGGE